MTENSEAGATPLAAQLRELNPGLVVLEVTGGLEREVVLTLAERDVPVVIAKARQVRDFAKATGCLAKTDQLAPLLLAVFESGAPDGFSSSRRTRKTQESRARGAQAQVTGDPERQRSISSAATAPLTAHLVAGAQEFKPRGHDAKEVQG